MSFYFVGWQGYFLGWGNDDGTVVVPAAYEGSTAKTARRALVEAGNRRNPRLIQVSNNAIMSVIHAFLRSRHGDR